MKTSLAPRSLALRLRRGDTLIEVALAIAIFSLVAFVTMSLMNQDLSAIQGTLELDMARNEIDAQAEALRFIHNSYLSERELIRGERVYQNLWLELSRATTDTSTSAGAGLSNNPATISAYPAASCAEYYDKNNVNDATTLGDVHSLFADSAFVLNTRNIDPNDDVNNVIIRSSKSLKVFTETSLYPRIIFTRNQVVADETSTENSDELEEKDNYNVVYRAEGIWVIAARDATDYGDNLSEGTDLTTTPEFYDFHIRTCWYGPGRSSPTTISTIIRLYNPEYVEGTR